MHSCSPWVTSIRRVQVYNLPAVVAPAYRYSRTYGASLRFHLTRRYIYSKNAKHTSSNRFFSTSMEDKDNAEMFLRAKNVLSKLNSPPFTPRSGAHLGCFLTAVEQAESTYTSASVRITVYGVDQTLSAQKFVTAILDDPLSSEERLQTKLRDRRKFADRARMFWDFHHDSHHDSHLADSTPLPSPFLSRFAHPVNLQELSPATPQLQHAIPVLLTSHIPIVIITPFLTTAESLASLSSILPPNPHAIFLVNSGLDNNSETAKLIKGVSGNLLHCSPSRVLCVDIDRAMRGLDALRLNPHSPTAIKQYQDDFLGSNVPQVIATLEETIKLGSAVLQADSRTALFSRLITSCSSLINEYHSEISNTQLLISSLLSSAHLEKEKALREVLGAAAEDTEVGRLELGEEDRHIAKGIDKAANNVRPTMDSLKWWKLPLVVDDISDRIDQATEAAYVKEFQNQLVYQTGRLSSLQTNLISRTYGVLRSLPQTFNSPILENSLSQISSNPSFPLAVDTLHAPLHARLRTLRYATRALHAAAQRALMVTFSTSAFSTIAAYAMWMAGYLDGPTVLGAGLFAFTLGLRYAVGWWERAKNDWWADWWRVGEGLERDVKKAAIDVLDRQVCIFPLEACKGLETLVAKRRSELADSEGELENLRRQEGN